MYNFTQISANEAGTSGAGVTHDDRPVFDLQWPSDDDDLFAEVGSLIIVCLNVSVCLCVYVYMCMYVRVCVLS